MGFAQVTAKPRRVKHLQVAMPVPLVKAMQQVESPAQRVRAPKASQPAEPRQVSGNLQEQVKSARPETAPVVEQLDLPALVFAVQAERSSAPSRD